MNNRGLPRPSRRRGNISVALSVLASSLMFCLGIRIRGQDQLVLATKKMQTDTLPKIK